MATMAQQLQAERVPTVDDLRVKTCYICREEERFDNPEHPPRAWTHPCACTLVAHESCLLQWVKSAQQDPSLRAKALKCPQCGAQYELESDNPLPLRVLNTLNDFLSRVGQATMIFGVVSILGTTIYAVSTSYGAFAVKEFLGDEMYNLLLTDDPAKWPLHAYIHLPMIPFSLILSRTRYFDTFPLLPLLITWSTSPPVRASPSSSSGGLSSFSPSALWGAASRTGSTGAAQAGFAPALNWPPTPAMAMVLFPFIRRLYRRAFDRLTRWVLGSPAAGPNRGRVRRIIFALNENDPAPVRLRIGANIDQVLREGAAPNAPAPAAAPAPAQGANHAAAPAPAAAALANEQAGEGENENDAAADAERTLHVTTSSLGRFIGGALLIPTISKHMGALLLRLSRHSSLLRAFLAIRDRPVPGGLPPARIQLFARPPGSDAGLLRQVAGGLVAGLHVLCGGTPTWNAHDPVWWRNAVGLGLFVFAKDCVGLWHLWLAKRELESRHVKSRSFAGIDIRELDLINPPQSASSTQLDAAPVATQLDAPTAPTQT
ncbi:hypothetical protein PYCCODRAFT_1394132 [Trametes coccinea BRFM310]|uniref:RING-CH-type domain-containing protein n=1 Tax=Trametes coccinea (strain BRFM310) TaxID=1353009 RepID=A0A1Y2IH82_TRAC3|nr:hypothetical protein PYCCODRAFT_1394132 [Trametes coccinea BRFM310]